MAAKQFRDVAHLNGYNPDKEVELLISPNSTLPGQRARRRSSVRWRARSSANGRSRHSGPVRCSVREMSRMAMRAPGRRPGAASRTGRVRRDKTRSRPRQKSDAHGPGPPVAPEPRHPFPKTQAVGPKATTRMSRRPTEGAARTRSRSGDVPAPVPRLQVLNPKQARSGPEPPSMPASSTECRDGKAGSRDSFRDSTTRRTRLEV